MYLLPQISTYIAESIAQQLCGLAVQTCRQHRAFSHTNQIYSPTGGTRISEQDYSKICEGLHNIAHTAGYPHAASSTKMNFDVNAAIFLDRDFRMTDNEASKPGIWNFLSCVALPDLVRWRFLTERDTPIERFVAGPKNTFQRLWWRVKAYRDPTAPDPYWLVREIGEDESVGIMERTGLSGMRPFVVIVLQSLLECHKTNPSLARSELMRDAMKRFRRLGGILAIEHLEEANVRELCRSTFADSASSLTHPQKNTSARAQQRR
jgi:hypothetical protein